MGNGAKYGADKIGSAFDALAESIAQDEAERDRSSDGLIISSDRIPAVRGAVEAACARRGALSLGEIQVTLHGVGGLSIYHWMESKLTGMKLVERS